MLACERPPAFGECFEEKPQINGVKSAWLVPARNLGVEVIIVERRFRRMTAVRADGEQNGMLDHADRCLLQSMFDLAGISLT